MGAMVTSTAAQDDDGMSLIDGYARYLKEIGRTDATIQRRREILATLDRQLPFGLERVCYEDLAAWLFRDREQWSRNTVATYRAAIVDAYGFWCNPEDPWLAGENPTRRLPAVRRPRGVARPITDAQLRHILTEAPEPVRTCALLAAYQGLRCLEIAALDREHVTAEQLIVVRGKGGRPRVHRTDPRVWTVVEPLPDGPVVRNEDGGRLTCRAVSQRCAYWFQVKLELPGVTLHRLRHWLGTTMQREYKDLRVTQKALGHLSVSSTQIYTDATDEQEAAAHMVLPTLVEEV